MRLYGSEGALFYDMTGDRIYAAQLKRSGAITQLEELTIPVERARGWTVEADFVNAIRHGTPIELTDFATGVQYMEFTEAVALSAELGEAIALPLQLGSVADGGAG